MIVVTFYRHGPELSIKKVVYSLFTPSPFLLFIPMMTVCYSMICVVLYDLLTNLGKSLLFLPKPLCGFLKGPSTWKHHHFCTGLGAKNPIFVLWIPARFLWSLTCVLQWKQDWFYCNHYEGPIGSYEVLTEHQQNVEIQILQFLYNSGWCTVIFKPTRQVFGSVCHKQDFWFWFWKHWKFDPECDKFGWDFLPYSSI